MWWTCLGTDSLGTARPSCHRTASSRLSVIYTGQGKSLPAIDSRWRWGKGNKYSPVITPCKGKPGRETTGFCMVNRLFIKIIIPRPQEHGHGLGAHGSQAPAYFCACPNRCRLGFVRCWEVDSQEVQQWREVVPAWIPPLSWKGAWQPTPVFLLGVSHGQRSLVGYSPQGHKESDTTEAT